MEQKQKAIAMNTKQIHFTALIKRQSVSASIGFINEMTQLTVTPLSGGVTFIDFLH